MKKPKPAFDWKVAATRYAIGILTPLSIVYSIPSSGLPTAGEVIRAIVYGLSVAILTDLHAYHRSRDDS